MAGAPLLSLALELKDTGYPPGTRVALAPTLGGNAQYLDAPLNGQPLALSVGILTIE